MRALRWRSSAAKASLNLPRTTLPSHHSPHLSEPPLVPRLSTHHYLAQSSSRPDATLWTLHDGPPYANGPLHMGHLLNKVLKDTINRYKLLTGHRIAFTPGWDCHGLPIELKAISLLSQPPPSPPSTEGSPPAPSPAVSPSPSALELRRAAAACAREAIERQRESFKRFGVMGDWNSPYTTMDPAYEASELGRGLVYRGSRPVHWSPAMRTALAEAELEYKVDHTSTAAFIAFELCGGGSKALQAAGEKAAAHSASLSAL
ncbi:MAG: hypothetical protein SGPRY_007215, partial [Prymnesium sp.]